MNFYKLARPDGYDFYTGKTINYRENIGKTVKCPNYCRYGNLCSESFIHASKEPNQCFVGAKIPCSAYVVEGEPIKEDSDKCGFKSLKIVKELNPEELFEWNYKEACNPIHPFKIKPPKKITKKHLELLKTWASVGDSAWDLVWASVGDSAWDSVRNSVWNLVWNLVGVSVWNLIGNSVWNSVWDSVRGSVWAYVGWIFKDIIEKWEYIEHEKGEYPFQPAVDLWKMGLISSFDGKKWRLHGGKKAKILWEGKL